MEVHDPQTVNDLRHGQLGVLLPPALIIVMLCSLGVVIPALKTFSLYKMPRPNTH